MRKWALRIGFFLLSLALGLGTEFVVVSPAPISLCDIEASPEKYSGKLVRLRVVISNDVFPGGPDVASQLILARSLCAARENQLRANVYLDPKQLGLVNETTHVLQGENYWRESKSFLTEAVLLARLEIPPGISWFDPQYDLSEARIERVITTHEFDNNEQRAQWIKSNSR